jgi:hypothetical protein
MSDSDSEADTEDYEPPQPTWRWLEADEFMETEYMQDEFLQDEADEFANATWKPYPTVMEDKDRIRDQRMIMVFYFCYYFVCHCIGPSIGLHLHL